MRPTYHDNQVVGCRSQALIVTQREKSVVMKSFDEMSPEELREALEASRAENAKLKEKQSHKPTYKVSEKGAVSVYGLGRFPVTLYRGQMEKLLDAAPEIREFIAENASKLKVKE